MLSAEALRSAMRSSRAGDGLAVSTTGSAAESVKWLASMDRALRRRLGLSESLGWADMTVPMIMEACALATVALPDGQLQPIAYEGFAAASRKTQPVTLMDAFARGIRHVPSLSAARAQALLVFAPTMAGLDARFRASAAAAEEEIAGLATPGQNRSLGPAVAARLRRAVLWGALRLSDGDE
ncbi:hypothetical protein FNF29_04060 [Cafeteria roenbergensis]|uniref:Uncharacterized protein n=1 Tax=Cafeteria roenbergensis TaxID=33653 RepID=A0A5A8CI80_CAFRO|nr:hypothetical protein FNF29_04060 [Cafeteria roenbergensis]|eukprot:KAA0152194.1 hypothetical protein FNF29_04060 [Cafeteria roenbergensis]